MSPIKAFLLVSLLCPLAAQALTPTTYMHIRDIKMASVETPRVDGEPSALGRKESRHHERLPMQLRRSLKKISAHKYKPHRTPTSK